MISPFTISKNKSDIFCFDPQTLKKLPLVLRLYTTKRIYDKLLITHLCKTNIPTICLVKSLKLKKNLLK